MSFIEELVLKVIFQSVEFEQHQKINGNQTTGRQFNFIQFNEASMQNEDFGKGFTVKVLFRGE